MTKHLKKIVILSLFSFLVFGIGSDPFAQGKQTENYLFGLEILNWPGTGISPISPDTVNSIVPQCARKHYSTLVLIRDAILDWTYFRDQFGSQGQNCFPQTEYESIIAIREEKDDFFSVHFFIRGHDMIGGGNTQYGLHLYEGQIVGGTLHGVYCDETPDVRWPPQKSGEYTVIQFKKWEIIVEGYRAPKKKQAKKCVGMGEFTNPVEFLVTNLGEI